MLTLVFFNHVLYIGHFLDHLRYTGIHLIKLSLSFLFHSVYFTIHDLKVFVNLLKFLMAVGVAELGLQRGDLI